MEIHSPEHPILSVREFFVHIGTVTIGILIALSLEQLVEWNHHRHLIQEARENIRAELQDNRNELKNHLAIGAQLNGHYNDALQWINKRLKNNKDPNGEVNLNFSFPELHNTSWTTAQATGALGLMSYPEVKQAAEIYQLQDEYVRLQRRALDEAIAAGEGFVQVADVTQMSAADLLLERSRLRTGASSLVAELQVGKSLEERYERALKTEPGH